jgi:hypothetical protein
MVVPFVDIARPMSYYYRAAWTALTKEQRVEGNVSYAVCFTLAFPSFRLPNILSLRPLFSIFEIRYTHCGFHAKAEMDAPNTATGTLSLSIGARTRLRK